MLGCALSTILFRSVPRVMSCFLGSGVIFTTDRWPRSARMFGVDEVRSKYSDKAKWLSSTHVCQGASIGAGAILLCGITIDAYSLIGAGAVVKKSVAPHALVMGNPARQIGWVCLCARKLGAPPEKKLQCPFCLRRYQVIKRQLVAL